MQNDPHEINKRINLLMKKLGLNQKGLADLLNITQPAVSKYLRDRIPPPLILLKLARAGQTTIEWILTGSSADNRVPVVTEPMSDYRLFSNLEGRIARLPEGIQITLLRLIVSIESEVQNIRKD